MKIIEQYIEPMGWMDGEEALWRLEAAARTCYKSEGSNVERDVEKRNRLLRHAVRRGHTSVLEHVSFTFRVITNRGVSHEWVRHRIGCSYSQESTRYCNYGHASEISVIWPWYLGPLPDSVWDLAIVNNIVGEWASAMSDAEQRYLKLLGLGCKPEEARGVLPNDLKTEFVVTMNIVALRHFFKQRCTPAAHPQIRGLSIVLLSLLNRHIPVVFEDLAEEYLKA